MLSKQLIQSTRIKTAFSAIFFLALAIGLLKFPAAVKERLYTDLNYCLSSLIPSLFPFIALTSYAVNAPVSRFFDKYLGFISRYLFRLPRRATVTILMGLIGGYPSGASGISAMLKNGEITKKEAARLLCFCVNPGIAYAAAYVGESVLHSKKIGWMLFFSVLFSSILMGAVMGLFHKLPNDRALPKKSSSKNALIQSASDASSAMIRMTACILLFSTFLALLEKIGFFSSLSAFISSAFSTYIPKSLPLMLMEITGGIRISLTESIPVSFYAFALAFAGICVHMQVFSFFSEFPMSKLLFILSRAVHAVLSLICFNVLLRLFPDVQTVFLNSSAVTEPSPVQLGAGISGGISLLIMCVAFLFLSRIDDREKNETI